MKQALANISAVLATASFLAACQDSSAPAAPANRETGPVTQNQYAEAVRSVKASTSDPKRRELEVSTLRNQFDLPAPVSTPEELEIAEAHARSALASLEASLNRTGTAPLPKSAVYSKTLVKDYSLSVNKTYVGSATLSYGNTLSVTASAISSADPFIVLFTVHSTAGAYGHVTVRAYDDDGGGGLSSYASTTHSGPGSSPLTIYYIVFSANGSAGVGNVDISVNNNGSMSYAYNVPARAYGAVNNNYGPAPCGTPYKSEIVVSGSSNYFSLDLGNSRGAWNEAYNNSWWIPPMSSSGLPNFVIGYVTPASSEYSGTLKQYDECL